MPFPAGILAALAPKVASAVSIRAVAAALNHLLAQHPNARHRLSAHASKKVCIGLDDADSGVAAVLARNSQLWFEIDAQGALRTTTSGEADASLLVKPSIQAAMDMASGGRGELARHLRVEGDVLLAGLLGELIQSLEWDYEDDLSRVIGDIPARRVGDLASRVGAAGQQVGRAVGRRAAQAMTGISAQRAGGGEASGDGAAGTQRPGGEDAPLVSRSVFDSLNDELQALNSRVDRLEQRLRKK
jgi:ubiquinone biosynthesis protein UbiJ